MRDLLDRPLRDLRISVTDRCNLRCRYCMPREVYGPDYVFLPREELLSFEEIARLARVLAAQGVDKLRLTGGEPLLRRELERLVEMLAASTGSTTSRSQRTACCSPLRRARSRCRAQPRDRQPRRAGRRDAARGRRRADLRGAGAGGHRRGASRPGSSRSRSTWSCDAASTSDCVLAMAEHFRGRPQVLRFIEYMDVGPTNGWRREDVVSAAEIRRGSARAGRWSRCRRLAQARSPRRYRYRDGEGEIGLIHSVSEPFCASCTRARLSADGKLLHLPVRRRGHDLRALLRGGASDEERRRAHARDLGRAPRPLFGRACDARASESAGEGRDVLHRWLTQQADRLQKKPKCW